ncbi:amidohydrolase-like protein 2 [Aspergillus affinis]|uniref:amidohydrolase-like protein 2 n=1 Tax=Aspergillus affinis TaxID=1070780 RepID=UPI0022FF12CF|nr:amidohydrolase-like protein 2 [Aspergillus affinis]KAI9037192.1 amidohydrolase-like protein 2 [Aspergillus affinis]
MLLSLTCPAAQGEPEPKRAAEIASRANDWLASEVKRNPQRFGALAALSMHSGAEAARARTRRRMAPDGTSSEEPFNSNWTSASISTRFARARNVRPPCSLSELETDSSSFLSAPFNLWRACHWYNKPVKQDTRPSKEVYAYYFKHNVSITHYPYDTVQEAQDWWKTVDLPDAQKKLVARENAIKLFKLPLEL